MKQFIYIEPEWLQAAIAGNARIAYFQENAVNFSVHLIGNTSTALGVPLGDEVPLYVELAAEFANGDRIQVSRPLKNHEQPNPEIQDFIIEMFSKLPL